MAAMSIPTVQISTYYLDHDDCTVHGGPQGHETYMFDEPAWVCVCGGVYYLPTADEVFDL